MSSGRVIEVWAPWCRPCRAIQPLVEETATDFADRVELSRINADQAPERVRELRVGGVPTLIALHGDTEVARLTGTPSKEAIESLFAVAAGGQNGEAGPRSSTDRSLRLIAAAAVMVIGLVSGPSVVLMIVAAGIAASALPGRTTGAAPPYRRA